MKWHPVTRSPKKPGTYVIICPSADPERPHASLAWFEPHDSEGVVKRGNTPGWQLLDIWVQSNGCVKVISHWADWRDDLPSRRAQLAITRKRR